MTVHCITFAPNFGRSDTFYSPLVPLGQRRRFGPAPAEDGPAPQLAQPSPSAYPRSQHQDESPGKRGRDESPVNGDPKGKHKTIICLTSTASLHRALFFGGIGGCMQVLSLSWIHLIQWFSLTADRITNPPNNLSRTP
jgi:hypothetical protein